MKIKLQLGNNFIVDMLRAPLTPHGGQFTSNYIKCH